MRVLMLVAWLGVGGSGAAEVVPLVLRMEVETASGSHRGCGVWTEMGVVTAWHVVEGAKRVEAVLPDGARYVGRRWWRLGGEDVAVVRLVGGPLRVAGVRMVGPPVSGTETGRCVGYWGDGFKSGVAWVGFGRLGAVEAARPGQEGIGARFMAFGAPVVGGCSGSPVLVGGELVGVVSHTSCGASFVAPVGGGLEPGEGADACDT